MRLAILLMLVLYGCSHEPTTPTQVEGSTITSVDMRNDAGGTMITFDTGHCRGIVKIEPGIITGYQMITKSNSNGESTSTTTIMVAGRELTIEGSKLRLGERVVGPLTGEVKIEIKKDGIFVDGEKKSDF